MYKIVILLFSFFLLIPQQEETIVWSSDRKLTWDDFRARPQARSAAVALTASGITFGYSIQKRNNNIVDFEARISTHFYPDKSWVVQDHANEHILRHEQLHFDITELHVRKLREAVSKLKASNTVTKQLDELHVLVNKQLREVQSNYDEQSNHSINVEAQKQWEAFVEDELQKLAEYASK